MHLSLHCSFFTCVCHVSRTHLSNTLQSVDERNESISIIHADDQSLESMKHKCYGFSSLVVIFYLLLPFANISIDALDNGLARTPPMGWLSWVAFYCEVDCKKHPNTCISERLFVEIIDRLVSDGYRDAGYEYFITDDCWLAKTRDAQGRLQADPDRFPRGIEWLINYVHQKGLKFGIYEDIGTDTCGGYPGVQGHLKIDAESFAKWNVDYVKMDGCNAEPVTIGKGYMQFGDYLNHTGRPMVYSCEWPLYEFTAVPPLKSNYSLISKHCNSWRNYYDIAPQWGSILNTISYYDLNQDLFSTTANVGPGQWFDPDMLVVGNPGVNIDQAKVQMAIWSIWSANWLMSVDLRNISKPFRQLLQNPKVIDVNQDSLGIMGKLVAQSGFVRLYLKPMLPLKPNVDGSGTDYSYAIAVLNTHNSLQAQVVFRLGQLNLTHNYGYDVEDLFNGTSYGRLYSYDNVMCLVNSTGVVLLKATAV